MASKDSLCASAHINGEGLSVIPAHALLNNPDLLTNHMCLLSHPGDSLADPLRNEFGERQGNSPYCVTIQSGNAKERSMGVKLETGFSETG